MVCSKVFRPLSESFFVENILYFVQHFYLGENILFGFHYFYQFLVESVTILFV